MARSRKGRGLNDLILCWFDDGRPGASIKWRPIPELCRATLIRCYPPFSMQDAEFVGYQGA